MVGGGSAVRDDDCENEAANSKPARNVITTGLTSISNVTAGKLCNCMDLWLERKCA